MNVPVAAPSFGQLCGTYMEIDAEITLRTLVEQRDRLLKEIEALRNQIADAIPLFGFYRNLLRWLFLSPDEPAPAFSSVRILLKD